MKYAIVTFGCRVNQADSLRLEMELCARGAEAVDPGRADLVIVNTCSVTATADQGARQAIRRVARENPQATIVATGCYATRCEDDVAALPGVVRVVRNDDKLRLLDFVPEVNVPEHDGPCGTPIEPGIAGRTAFTIRAQTGCEEACAFCIIPKTRGAARSLPIEALVEEARRAAAAGFKEIAIAGVHLGSYGRDLSPRTSLFDLLGAFAAIDADVSYRISSLEPMECTEPIVDLVATSGRFMPHFHLPLQHASDRILRAMRRPYTLDHYRRLVDGIQARLPQVAIGTDLLVGFPGETDDDFAAMTAYVASAPLSHLHVFPYSERPGTEAARMAGRVPPAVIRDRGAELRRIGAGLAARFRASQVDSERPGLTLEDGTLVVTDNYLKVRVPPGLPRNTRVRVRIAAGNAVGSAVVQ
ncbi:MAG TPA: MiaB/RimO family radical SAM methylthiotransferase [Vicinamibacterales bacterium]